ncbi:MAG: hypothetical protein IIC08_01515 [Proteobacteria bacterium]|nr:hypothetical protein [Pseudomonadota bacterium]
MNTRLISPFRAALLALLLLCAPAALAGEDAPYPIWWSPELGLESLDDIDGLLDKIFPEHRQFVITLHWSKSRYKVIPGNLEGVPQYETGSDPAEYPSHHIANCQDLFEWSDHRNDSLPYSYLDPIFAYYAAYCYSLDALKISPERIEVACASYDKINLICATSCRQPSRPHVTS